MEIRGIISTCSSIIIISCCSSEEIVHYVSFYKTVRNSFVLGSQWNNITWNIMAENIFFCSLYQQSLDTDKLLFSEFLFLLIAVVFWPQTNI